MGSLPSWWSKSAYRDDQWGPHKLQLLGWEQEGRGGMTSTNELSGGLSHPYRKVEKFLDLP